MCQINIFKDIWLNLTKYIAITFLNKNYTKQLTWHSTLYWYYIIFNTNMIKLIKDIKLRVLYLYSVKAWIKTKWLFSKVIKVM